MNEFQAAAVLIGFFALRCIVPLLLMVAIGYGMNKLVDRWAVEEAARVEGRRAPAAAPSSRPATTIPCWLFKNCGEEARAKCPAAARPGVPCWLVRMQMAGRMPDGCQECAIYHHDTLGEPLPALL